MRTYISQTMLMLALLLALGSAASAQAHGGPPRVELTAQRATPGAQLTVFGINLGADLPIAIALVGASTYPLGSATCDGLGDFQAAFTLPADLPLGTYLLQATAPDSSVVQTQLEVESASAATLRAWASALRNLPLGLALGLLAGLFGLIALALWLRDRRRPTSMDTTHHP